MALDFPLNPTIGQVFQNYVWNGTAWTGIGSANNLGVQVAAIQALDVTQNTRLTSLETANATTNRSGLVPIVPTSISTSSGSASFNSTTGLITLSGCGDAILNGIFTSTYKNYKIIFNSTGSGNTNYGSIFAFRYSSGGVTNSSSNYSYTTWYTQSGANGNLNGGTSSAWMWSGYGKDVILEVGQPADSSTGTQMSFAGTYNNTLMLGQCGYNANAAFDGIQFANNLYTGTIQVYGYK